MRRILSFAILAMLILFLTGCSNQKISGNAIKETGDAIKEINIDAFQFGYKPDTITINKGDKVRLIINNLDVIHGIRIPDLNIEGNNTIEFTADAIGEFTWYCNNYCGQNHKGMTGKIIIK